ncbi:ABC transporter ATP-binding protein [Synechococcus sp. KORDI-100]|uniref:ABC transporter ATP-binding protein n=1 Tax=Synechococcus sp. KORDI-100 TaxID=1280380 RepID=UPI0005706A47|nr:ABC transporter ATP-binding protein [Synechococcus sp. KORDI-100]
MRGDHRVSPLSTTPPPVIPPPVELRDLWHRFDGAGQSWTLKGIDLKLAAGELLGLLGPSGCGKTTLLRLIAGFERPSRGSVHLQQGLVAGDGRWVPPERRGVGMVFQDYALFPHLNAWQNACFGLRPGQDVSRARWLLELLGLADLEERFSHQLSGGQRQRLALARALAPAPAVVLMDEPLSNLDVEVRLRLRGELTSVLKLCGASGLIVTHDPGEALAICDRVAVMNDGRFDQCAEPRQLVQDPSTPFVGRFVLQANLLPVISRSSETLHCALGSMRAHHSGQATLPPGAGSVLVDPAAISLDVDSSAKACVMGREFLGEGWQYRVQLDSQSVRVNLPLDQDHPRGTRCRLGLRPEASVVLFPERIRLRASDPCDGASSPALRPSQPA